MCDIEQNLANNMPYLMIAAGVAVTISIVMIASWVILYRLFPNKVASPYPNLYLGEDPHKKT